MTKVKLFILGLILFGAFQTSAHAETITYKRLNDIYFNLTVDGKTTSNHVTAFYLDGRLAYCIEPGKDITTKTYNSYPNWEKITITHEQANEIEKIGYYGYEYPNHQTDKYYIATQELIWKTIKNVDIKWTTSSGQTIDITKEKAEIQTLVNNHNIVPSFTNEIISGKTNETKTIIDTNNVLNNFELDDSKYHNIQIKDNQITITFNENKVEEEIKLTRKKYDQKTLLVYQYPNSQSLAALRLNTKENLFFKVKSEEEPKEIVKVPSTGEVLKAIHFGIYKFEKIDNDKFN